MSFSLADKQKQAGQLRDRHQQLGSRRSGSTTEATKKRILIQVSRLPHKAKHPMNILLNSIAQSHIVSCWNQ